MQSQHCVGDASVFHVGWFGFMDVRCSVLVATATLVVAEKLAAKKAEREEEMRLLAEEEARLAKERMFTGYVVNHAIARCWCCRHQAVCMSLRCDGRAVIVVAAAGIVLDLPSVPRNLRSRNGTLR